MLDNITAEERKVFREWEKGIGLHVPEGDSLQEVFILGMRAAVKQQETKQPVGFLYEREGFQDAFSKFRLTRYLNAGASETPLYRSDKPLPVIDFKNLTERLANAMSEQLMQMTPEECKKVLAGLRSDPNEETKDL